MDDTRLRIAVVEPDGMGGLAHYAFQLCTALADSGAEVTLVTSRHYELGDLPRRFALDSRLRLWPTVDPACTPPTRGLSRAAIRAGRGIRRAWRALILTVEWARLTRHLRGERPDFVLFSTIRFPYLALFLRAMRRSGLALAQVCHEWEYREARFGVVERVNRRLAAAVYPCFSAIFLHGDANLDAFADRYPAIPRARLHAIPHGDESLLTAAADGGGDLRARYRIPPDRPVALFFGGLRPSKGLDDLLDAFALAREEVDASLVITGYPAGVDPARLREGAQRLGIAADVVVDARYVGLSEVGPLLRTATVVALPYRTATASGVLQAAYAFGRPVVVTATGGLPEAVAEGRSGFVVPPGDPSALARALVKLLADPRAAARMGAQGARLAADRYSWGPIGEQVLDVLRSTWAREGT